MKISRKRISILLIGIVLIVNQFFLDYQVASGATITRKINGTISARTKATHTISNKSHQVIVAVIDTGIDYTHQALNNFIWVNPKEISNDGIDNDNNGFVDDIYGWNFYSGNNVIYNPNNNLINNSTNNSIKNSITNPINNPNSSTIQNSNNTYDNHGTHLAGIIINNIPAESNIKIMSVKVLGGKNQQGTTKNLVKAIKYAEEMGASICNISLGTNYYDKNLEKVMKASKMLFVVAAGNDMPGNNNDTSPIYPASYSIDNIISVANLTEDNQLHETSNFGANSVDIAALGTDIYSTLTNNQYGFLTGTSMAAAKVTGILAAVYSSYPNINLLQAKESIFNTVEILPELSDKVKTSGQIDSIAALKYFAPTKIHVVTKKTLKVNKSYLLKPSVLPAHASTVYTFNSSNEEIATVHKTTGKIIARKKGTTNITVTTQNGLTANCVITVK